MYPPNQHSWINLAEIKTQLIRKLGPDRSKQYFDYLNRFLSLKLSKSEFDKLCITILGKDSIRLHNQLIRSILKNACTGKSSTGVTDDPSRTVGNKKPSDGAYHQNGSIPVATQVTSPLALTNGDILPPSPRKARTAARERRGVDRKSALGPNGTTIYASFSSSTPQSGELNTVLENGTSSSSKAMHHHHHQELIQENGDGKRLSDRTSLHAPLGVPYCPVSLSGPHAEPSSSKCVGVLHTDSLLDTITLRERVEQIAAAQGLQGVSMDCANVLNNGLDAYLKGLIRSCAELKTGGSVHEPTQSGSLKNPTHLRPVNGVRPGHLQQLQNNSWALNGMQENEPKRLISLLDFRVAMELNRQKLGEDWPVILEKICARAFEG